MHTGCKTHVVAASNNLVVAYNCKMSVKLVSGEPISLPYNTSWNMGAVFTKLHFCLTYEYFEQARALDYIKPVKLAIDKNS